MRSVAFLLDEEISARNAAHLGYDYSRYGPEFLRQTGLSFCSLNLAELGQAPPPVLWTNSPLGYTPEEAEVLRSYVEQGGILLVSGDVRGLGFLVERPRRSGEVMCQGYLSLGPEGQLPIRAAVKRTDFSGEAWGELLDENRQPTNTPAVGVRKVGQGLAAWLPVDVCRCVVEFMQGVPVWADGAPAPDGTAPINDGILKCDDGAVARWVDREVVDGTPAFLIPAVDRLREMFIQTIWRLAEQRGRILPQVWYWPEGQRAVGLLSHDSDSNETRHAWALMELLDKLGVRSTWCIMYPGGYDKAVYAALKERGHEIALHFEAFSEQPDCTWSQRDLKFQHQWLLQESGAKRIYSQKNHLTRWEGWTVFFRWLEDEGIWIDQSKGPSKVGNMGFLFGTCHPWRPMDDALNGHHLFHVLEIPYLTVDMYGGMARAGLRRRILDEAVAACGVAHFLFHPQRLDEPDMAEAIADIVQHGQTRGIQWWTSEQIGRWQWQRASIQVEQEEDHVWQVQAPVDLSSVTLVFPPCSAVYVGGREVAVEQTVIHGLLRTLVTIDLPANLRMQVAIKGVV